MREDENKNILVTDGRSIASLATLRSLGAKGFRLTSAEAFRYNYSFFSRHAHKRWLHHDPSVDQGAFLQDLLGHLRSERYATIISFRDDTNLVLSRHREEIQKHVRLCMPELDTLLIGQDKARTARAALQAGVPIPKTFFPEDISLEEIARAVAYPVLVRPRRSSGARGIEFAATPKDLFAMYEKVKAGYDEPIVQEFLEHTREHFSACFLFNRDSELRASFVYQELRQYPINGGPATLAVSVKHPQVIGYGTRLLKQLGWQGVAHIDFLVDPRDGTPKLLEINPRFWMSLPLAIASGVDFPYLLYRIAVEGDAPPVTDYEAGRLYRWLFPADILWFLNVPDKLKNLSSFLRFRDKKGLCYAVLSLRDPLPVLGFMLQTLYFMTDKSRRDFILKRGW